MQEQSFEKFYFDKVATGEGCGCAERIIDEYEFRRLAGQPGTWAPVLRLPRKGALRRFLQKAGLSSRPKSPPR